MDRTGDELVSPGEVSDRKFCSACQCSFDSREEQMEHYKLDWHRFNLRQRIAGRSPITVEEFEKKTGMVAHQVDQQDDEEEEEEDDDISVQMKMEYVTMSTLDLREHEIKPSRKQRKKRKEKKTEATEKEEKTMESEGIILQTKITDFTYKRFKDRKGQTPYAVAPDKESRNMFRKFMAEHPDKYDYAKAQVPGPLTAEIESKKAEKKKAQKAAKKQREKERREEKRKEEEEQEEKRRFLALSEREKRALVAERRLAEQVAKNGGTITNIR
ncbi:ankyrin repeat and zinc finger domain-containing protein 1 isoform X4 [Silurus meridionalis]|nr:ankyrin repeat and zinc finger domain-containing protein 1 isoform X4 [Silurus meridionalis]